MHRLALLSPAIGLCAIVGACSLSQLTGAGVPAATAQQVVTVEQSLVNGGQLFCKSADALYLVTGVNVIGAAAAPIATACANLTVAGNAITGATPTGATVGQSATVANTTVGAATAVAASVPVNPAG
jgi:hypothetical protein